MRAGGSMGVTPLLLRLWYVPIFAAGSAFVMTFACFFLTLGLGHFDTPARGLRHLPLVSETAVHAPERWIFLALGDAAALAGAVTVLLLRRFVGVPAARLHASLTRHPRHSVALPLNVRLVLSLVSPALLCRCATACGLLSSAALVVTSTVTIRQSDLVHSLSAKVSFFILDPSHTETNNDESLETLANRSGAIGARPPPPPRDTHRAPPRATMRCRPPARRRRPARRGVCRASRPSAHPRRTRRENVDGA